MARFFLRRTVQALLALLGMAVVMFFLLHLETATPAHAILGKLWTPKKGAALDAKLGLSSPVPVQFVLWVRATLLAGGLASVIKHDLPPTLELLVLGVAMAFLLSVMIARLQMRRPGGGTDRILSAVVGLLSAVPGFFIGSLLLFVFAIVVPWFPPTGFPPIHTGAGLGSWAWHEVLPVTALALSAVGPWTRQLRASMGDVSSTDYVRTARAKGISERAVVARHIFRNALLPLVTLVGLSLPSMINTVIALEIIYAVPGAGVAFIGSLNSFFFANATTVALVLALVTILGSMLADFAYSFVDPRVEYR